MSRRLNSARQVSAAADALTRACGGCCTGAALRSVYDAVLAEPVPLAILMTLEQLGRGNTAAGNG